MGFALDLEDYHPSVLLHCWLGHLTCKIISEMTYSVSSGTLNPTGCLHGTLGVLMVHWWALMVQWLSWWYTGWQEHRGSDADHTVDGHAAAESSQRDADSLDQHYHGWTSRTEVWPLASLMLPQFLHIHVIQRCKSNECRTPVGLLFNLSWRFSIEGCLKENWTNWLFYFLGSIVCIA